MYYLTLVSGSQAGLRKQVSQDNFPRLLIGQADQCDWVLSDSGVESLHCLFEAGRDEVSVIALLGRIAVNGVGIDHRNAVSLQAGDCIDIGDSGLQLTVSESADSPIQAKNNSKAGKMPIRLPVFGAALVMFGASCYGLVSQNGFSVNSIRQTLPQLTDRVASSLSISLPADILPDMEAMMGAEREPSTQLSLQQVFEQSDLMVAPDRLGAASVDALKRLQRMQTQLRIKQKGASKAIADSGNLLQPLIQPMVAVKVDEPPFLTDKKGAVYYLNSRLPNGDLLIAIDNKSYTVRNASGRHRYSTANLQVLREQKASSLGKLAAAKVPLHFRGKATSKYDQYILKASATYGVDAYLIKAVIQTESNFNPQAVSQVGAQGLMQIMPTTAKGLDLRNPFSPEHNIMAGSKLLSRLLNKYEQNLDMALAAYNAGEGAVNKYNGVPPYKETMAYVEKVSQALDNFRKIDLAAK